MPCKIQIKQNITQKVEEKTEDLFGKPLDVAQKGARTVNSEYGYNVVRFYQVDSDYIDRQITIPSELVDIYYENELRIEEEESRQSQIEDARRAGEDYSDEYMFQTKNIFSAANEIQNKLKSLNKTINSMGSEKNIDEVLKKAGLEADLRKQFIKLVNDNPSLKSLKVSEVLSSYLREFVKDSDRQYYKAIDEPLSNELENILIDYFDKFKIRRQELDNLKEKFGVDSVGVFDVLAKTIYYAKNRNLLTLPEEYGHVFVELLGSISGKKADNPLFKYMFDNIDKWDGYQRVLRDYKDVYITKEGNMDIYKIKKEAIGQAIGIALVRNYKVQKGDKDFWAKVQEAIDYILNLIKGIDYVSLNTTVDSIAKDILNKNYDKLDRMKKDTSNYNLLSYSETIKNQNKIDGGKALKFMQWFSQKGMLITGSLAYRLQGTTYRPEIDALHDIDNIVPSDIHKVSLNKEDYLTPEQLESSRLYYKYISEGNYREAKKYKLQGNIRLNIDEIVDNVEVLQDFKKQFPETDFLYSFYNEKANAFYITINAIWSENKELKERFKLYTGSFNQRLENFTKEELEQIYLFDFFLRPESSEEYKKIEDPEFGLTLAHFNYAFYEKLNMMGRPKDAYDYQMWDYYNDESILAPDFNDRLVYFQIQKSQEEKPQPTQEVKPESRSEIVKSELKAINILQSSKADEFFITVAKNKITGDFFWRKMQADLGIPANQIEILKSFNTQDRGELIASLLANYSYAVEINLAIDPKSNQNYGEDISKGFRRGEFKYWINYKFEYIKKGFGENDPQIKISKEEYEQAFTKQENKSTDYYSNLTVPGGTNYTENEIATPAITPSIKGHAQFATDQGIGWFRSDDKIIPAPDRLIIITNPDGSRTKKGAEVTKTRRILEVQSDYFQKLRNNFKFRGVPHNIIIPADNNGKKVYLINEEEVSANTYNKAFEDFIDQGGDNQFLALLHKGDNWVTFFVKSIIQDSAKKGYEKVLFPSGDTASKVQGHTTLEEFKKQKQDRIKLLEEKKKKLESEGINEKITSLKEKIKQDKFSIEDIEYKFNPNPFADKGTIKLYEKTTGEPLDIVTGYVTNNTLAFAKDESEAKEIFNKFIKGEKIKYKDGSRNINDLDVIRRKENLRQNLEALQRSTGETEINELKKELERVEKEGFAALRPIYNFYENTIANVLKKQGYAPKQVTDEYGNTWNEVEIVPEREQQTILLQTEDVQMSTASEETIEKLKQIADKANIKLQTLDEYLKGNPEVNVKGVNALADTLRKIIAIAEGKEGVSITEELVHIATAMIEQADPKLITQMISKIDKFKIYKKVLDTYGKRKEYQLPNGKPDIRKIKKEAVDKLIAELIIKKLQGSNEFPELLEEETREMVSGFWQKILDFFRKIFRTSNIEIFELSADKIIKGDFAGITSEIINGEVYFQLSNAQKEFQQRVAADRDNIRKVEGDKKSVDPLLMDTEEASNFYEVKLPDGTFKRVLKRVTDRVHRWYEIKFGKNKEFTEAEKKFNNLKREYGIKYHHFFEEIYSRYFNPDGTKRDRLDPRTLKVSGVEQEIYNILENYFVELIKSHSKNGKTPLVFSELKVYDPKEGEAGTLDLVIVDENGKASIYDWKFMTIAESSNDVPWYKQGAFNIQLTRYREILRDVYGIKEFDKVRAIPILMDFKPKLKYVKGSDLEVSGIHIGSVDTSKITDLRLVPVLQEEETTGIAQLDKLISQLNSIYNQISKKEASTEEEKEFKRERLNMLRQAVRRAQGTTDVSGIIDVIKLMRLESDQLINDWETIYSKKPAASKDFENEELSDYAENLREFIVISDIFANIDKAIGSLIYNDSMVDAAKTKQQKEELKYRKKILDDIQSEASRINDSKEEIKKIAGKFADKFMGERNLVKGLLNPQAVWKNVASWFRGVSESPLKSVQILYKMVTNARDTASLDANKMIDELLQIRKAIVDKGGNTRDYIKKIYQKDTEGGIVNKLIYKFDKKFYELVDDNAVEGKRDKNWLLKNIDVEAYKKEALDILNNKIKYYTKLYSENETLRDELILKERRKWDISRSDFIGWNNYVIKRHPKEELWLSNEYKEVKKDPELLRLYNFILSVNDIAGETGYIQNRIHATFLPYVRKTMAESLAWDFSLSSVMKFSDDLKIRADEVGYGSINELTKELEYGIPKYYTYDFTKNYKEDGTVEYDYSDVSEDLFKNMILYVNHLHKYKYLSEIEEQLKLVKTIETFKDHYRTTMLGNVVIENNKPVEEAGNEENVAIFDKFLRALLYEQKYPIDSGDVAMSFSVRNGIKRAINAVAGREVYPVEEQPDAKSLVKTMDTVNRAFQLKTLGFEFISGAVNLFGANIQISTQAGNYFKAREVLKKEKDLLANRFKSEDEREMFRQLIDVFVPFKDDPSYEKLKEAGLTELTRRNFSDMLMFFMRVPEQHVEKSIFATLLDNVMVVDGNLVSIREYVNNKYKQRYSSGSEFASSERKIEEEIEELKKTKSISATKKLENGKLVIPGFDLNNRDEVRRLSVLTRRLSRNATGGMSDADINKMQMNVFTRSMMVFKNWIPKLVDTRFSEFRKTSDDFSVRINEDGLIEGEKYDIGRARLFFSFMQLNFVKSLKDMMDVMSVNDRGLEILDKLYLEYAAKYKEKTGEDLTMSREDFNDLIRTNLRNQFKEFAIAIALTASYMALGYLAPDDDDDKAKKNAFRFAQRTLDKFVSELMFFYNPVEFEKILSGNMFPAIGLFADITRFFNHFMAEVTGMDFSDATDTSEEVREKAQPVKNLAKTLPLAKSLLTWGAILDADFAKEYDITIQKETNR